MKSAIEEISNIIYNKLDYMYCDNCRFKYEISEEESYEMYGNWACEDCSRKYNRWGISKSVANELAEKIINISVE